MSYKYGHYFVGFVLFVTIVGFWASYFTRIGDVPLAFHLHAFSATSWLLLLIVQSASIHNRHNNFHKLMGKASFALFPLLIIGFVMIINVSADSFASQANPFIAVVGPAFGIGMAIAIAAYLTLYYLALRHRRNIKLHAGFMLATPLILFESPFIRILDQFFPWMNVIGSEGPRQVLDLIAISNVMVAVFAMALYSMDRKNGAPWLVATFFVLLQAVVMWFAPDILILETLFAAYSRIPNELMVLAGLLTGGLVAYLGWTRGTRPIAPGAKLAKPSFVRP